MRNSKTEIVVNDISKILYEKQEIIRTNQYRDLREKLRKIILAEIKNVMTSIDISRDLKTGETHQELFKRKLDIAWEKIDSKLERESINIVNEILREENYKN